MIVALGTKNPAKIEGVKRAFVKYFRDIDIVAVDSSSVAKAQPRGLDQMTEGAIARAKFALANTGGDFGVGVEAGIFTVSGIYFDNQQAAIVDHSGKSSLGYSAGYMLPKDDMDDMFEKGKELEEWAEAISGITHVGDKGGLIQHLTNGKMTRADLTEQCVTTALIPWLHRDVYGF